MNRWILVAGAVALSLAVLVTNDRAAIIERDLYAPGDRLLTYDTVNRREWLDVIATYGLSRPELDLLLDVDRPLAGFTVGTFDDVKGLLVSAGLDEQQIPGDQEFETVVTVVDILSGLLVETGYLEKYYYVSGRILDTEHSIEESFHLYAYSQAPLPPSAVNTPRFTTTLYKAGVDNGLRPEPFGYWLYRVAVPEPATIGLATITFAEVAFAFRLRRTE